MDDKDRKPPPTGSSSRALAQFQLRPSRSLSRTQSSNSSAPSGLSPFVGTIDSSTDATPISNPSSTPMSNAPSTPYVPRQPANTPVVTMPGSDPLSHPFEPVQNIEAAMMGSPDPAPTSSAPPPSVVGPAVDSPVSDVLSTTSSPDSITLPAMTDTPDPIPTSPAPLPWTEDPIIGTPASDVLTDPFATVTITEAPPVATPNTPADNLAPPPFIGDPIDYEQNDGPMFMNLPPLPPDGAAIYPDLPSSGRVAIGFGPTLPGSGAFPVCGLPQPSETPFFDEACKFHLVRSSS